VNALTILKYLGAVVGFGSVAFGLATKWKASYWRLTTGEAITCGLAIAGFTVGIASIYVQDRTAANAAEAQKQNDAADRAAHERETFSQSALTSLTVEWSFDHVPPRATAQSASRSTTPAVQRSRRCDMKTSVRREDERVALRWELGPVCIAKGLDVANAFNVPKASLPNRLNALLLTSIGDFPFDPANFADAGNSLPREPRGLPRAGFQNRSRLTLSANGQSNGAAVFDMRYYPTFRLGGLGGGAEVQPAFPLVTTLAGSRVTSNGGEEVV
jgi:hypothetical protein